MGRFSDLKIINEPGSRPEDVRREPEPRLKKAGKRDDPDYTQISVYIRKEPYYEAKRKLIGHDRDFSDLVNELLARWLSKNTEHVIPAEPS